MHSSSQSDTPDISISLYFCGLQLSVTALWAKALKYLKTNKKNLNAFRLEEIWKAISRAFLPAQSQSHTSVCNSLSSPAEGGTAEWLWPAGSCFTEAPQGQWAGGDSTLCTSQGISRLKNRFSKLKWRFGGQIPEIPIDRCVVRSQDLL